MYRSLLVLFLCVFALNEVFLAPGKVRIRDVSGMKNSRGLRRARSVSCHPMDEKCKKMCKDAGASEGDGLGYDLSSFVFCRCMDRNKNNITTIYGPKHYSESSCTNACKTHLEVDRGEVDDEGHCFCQYFGPCR